MTWKGWVTAAVRTILSVALLVVVWRNSHWSVALSITLMVAAMKIIAGILLAIYRLIERVSS